MNKAVTLYSSSSSNLIDFIEELADDHRWSYERVAFDELIVKCPGSWSTYRLTFLWVEDMKTLGITASIDMHVSPSLFSTVYELLCRINEQVWIGHFDLSDENRPTYRYTLLVSNREEDYYSVIEELIQISLTECERFYPAFQFALWAGKKPADALASAMLETAGEA